MVLVELIYPLRFLAVISLRTPWDEQEQEDMKGHQNPRCLKWVAGIVCLS